MLSISTSVSNYQISDEAVGSIQTRAVLVCSSRTIGVEYICIGDCVSLLGFIDPRRKYVNVSRTSIG